MIGEIDLADKGQSHHYCSLLDHAHLEGIVKLDAHDAVHACLVRVARECASSRLKQRRPGVTVELVARLG